MSERIAIAIRALETLEAILLRPKSPEIRDATIQRFEYTFEAVWKAASWFLREAHGMEGVSPKSVIRSCREVGAIDEVQARAAMVAANDRNLTVHTYNEDLAEEIFGRIAGHAATMRAWLEGMKREPSA